MARFSAAYDCQFSASGQNWDNLKQAIAATSGFQRWQREQLYTNNQQPGLSLDHQVRRYLRETLETLAY